MKNLNLTIFAALLSLLVSSSAFASVAGTPESEASTISLGFFNIKFINESSLLSWTTPSTVSGSAFTIERSEDGKSYNEIGKVKATGSSNFNFVDYKPSAGINYYRFKRVDVDGKLTISPVRVVITEKNSPFSTYPTYVKTSLTVSSSYVSNHDTTIKVISAKTGEVALETTLASDKTEMSINLSNLPAGNYVTKMDVDGKSYNSTFVKQ
jgi:hypothetical protein